MNLEDLKLPFEESEIEWRIGRCGENNGKRWATCLAYISARAIQDRLDKVCGPENWRVDYETIDSQRLTPGLFCGLSIRINNEWIEKVDGADQSDTEPFKGGISNAFKRSGSVWGIGRYLYGLEEGFSEIVEKNTEGAKYAKTKDNKIFYWRPPKLPSWAIPQKNKEEKKIADAPIGEGMPSFENFDDLPKEKPAPMPEYKMPTRKGTSQMSKDPAPQGWPKEECNHKWMDDKYNISQQYCYSCGAHREKKK